MIRRRENPLHDVTALTGAIGDALDTQPDEILRDAIRRAGVRTDITLPARDAEIFVRAWEIHGEGFFADVSAADELGEVRVRAFHGPRVYTPEQLVRLARCLRDDAADTGITLLMEGEET